MRNNMCVFCNSDCASRDIIASAPHRAKQRNSNLAFSRKHIFSFQ